MNPRWRDMAEDNQLFKAAAPALFGEVFSKKAKDKVDEHSLMPLEDPVQSLAGMAAASFVEGAVPTTPSFIGTAKASSGEEEGVDTNPTRIPAGPGNLNVQKATQ